MVFLHNLVAQFTVMRHDWKDIQRDGSGVSRESGPEGGAEVIRDEDEATMTNQLMVEWCAREKQEIECIVIQDIKPFGGRGCY